MERINIKLHKAKAKHWNSKHSEHKDWLYGTHQTVYHLGYNKLSDCEKEDRLYLFDNDGYTPMTGLSIDITTLTEVNISIEFTSLGRLLFWCIEDEAFISRGKKLDYHKKATDKEVANILEQLKPKAITW